MAYQQKAARRGRAGVFLVALLSCMAAVHLAHRAFVGGPRSCTQGRRVPITKQLRSKTVEECKVEEENPMTQIKALGSAGVVSYTLWEFAFWGLAGLGATAAFFYAKGHTPDFGNQEEVQEVAGEAFVVVNGARLLVPLRIGLAVATTPWVRENITDKLFPPVDPECVEVLAEDKAKQEAIKQ